ARAEQSGSDQIIEELGGIEARFVNLATSDFFRLETRRRIAEWKFKLLSERDDPFDSVKSLFEAVEHLGFTDLETEATLTLYFTEYCMRNGRSEVAREYLKSLCAKLTVAAEHSPLGYEHLKNEASLA